MVLKRKVEVGQPRATASLTAAEWKILAVLLVDGLLRRRGCWSAEAAVVETLRALALESHRLREADGFSERELFHLRSCFCPITIV